MEAITTLSEFLTKADTQFQVYDLGRRVRPLDPILFAQLEAGTLPYPTPRAGFAWLGILFWNAKASNQHYVWFLKLPLDERGLLNPAARNQFLQMVMEALGQDPAAALSEEQEERLANNPFTFTPGQEKMALFNALVRKHLAQPASVYFEPVQQYVSGQHPWEAWHQLGLQGFADLVSRPNSADDESLAKAIAAMPFEPLSALGSVMEHGPISNLVGEAWYRRWCISQEPHERQLCLRALAGSVEARDHAVDQLLSQPNLDQETLIVLAARLWEALDQHQMPRYLEHLAQYPGPLFNQIYSDLVAIPGQRAWVLMSLRSPERSEALNLAVARLVESVKGARRD
ncbi:DUF3549 family protein [Ferrimonas balearica]|uniref:DUF3549 family protein n=1 Tax=Ferrimonas balearica TaxID=44012 RepID=UPI001C9947B4|nr:DUF3549 family protein [Ferrimonas balearica]MBY5921389.1 DUF3549 family protein [Ferrimonas balearica]MBY5995926.1 DUF3549 family protein [Ferrimonas balearica]